VETLITYQDYQSANDKTQFIRNAITTYKNSKEFTDAVEAEAYFRADNTAIKHRPKWTMKKSGKVFYFQKNITISNFLFRFVTQQNQYLLANGLQLKDQDLKDQLGIGFDKTLESVGEKALVHGSCWGFWNNDHLEKFEIASVNKLNGFMPLFDELTGEAVVGIKFWQIDTGRPMIISLYELDGVTVYKDSKKDESIEILQDKKPYKISKIKFSNGKEIIEGSSNYNGSLPIIPLYANDFKKPEFSPSIKTKIDMFDKIFSDFGDNLERTNDIYWVISNFGGNAPRAKELLAEIEEYKAVFNSGTGAGASAEPRTIDVPYAARQTALEILENSLYADYMSMNMSEITGGSLTNVAIDTARFNLDTKTNRYEWQVFQFVQKILNLKGTVTEDIKFRRQSIANQSENIGNVITEFEAGLIDRRTALEKLDNIDPDEIDVIMARLAEEETEKSQIDFTSLDNRVVSTEVGEEDNTDVGEN